MENKDSSSTRISRESVDYSDDSNSSRDRPRTRARKRKRPTIESSTDDEDDVLPENTLEFEKNLHASAIKNNLDDASVKKILKKVVTNDHVLALVKLQEEEEEALEAKDGGHIPKLTRAKVKELKKVASGKPTWNLENLELTPIKHIPVKTRPEVKALIAQELPEDEDDDEYEPTNDDVPSDDDQTLESCSDIDSQPRTPATPTHQIRGNSPRIVKDGPFKVPQELTPARRKLDLEKEQATIALRTRSKLSLSETPIEHIESSFVPPDDLPMPAVDDLWNQFLTECLDPAPSTRHEDDDETDPEYNVAADPDAHDEDEEALENSIIKISKKELNDLVTELFSIIPESVDDCLGENMPSNVFATQPKPHWDGKQELLSEDESTNTAIRISDRITFERRDSTSYSVGKMEIPDEPEEEPQYLEIGSLPTPRTVPIQPDNRNGSISSKVDQLIKDTVETEEEMVQQPVNPPVIANMVRVVDGQAMNVVKIVVGQQAHAVPLPSVPLPLQRMQQRDRLICKEKTQITRIEVHMNSERCILPEQVIILEQQLRQHIQLAASNFLQLFSHPLNFGFGSTYKGYIENFLQLADKNPNSVANVCNLRPAMELVTNWEASVNKNTPENTEYLQFVTDDCKKWSQYMTRNKYYAGDFHVMFKKAVADSPVFLYPYLLPPRPYHNRQRRSAYLPSEDELITLGLDQFWQYVVDNPKLYPKPRRSNPRHRWWLNATLELISKHMLPFLNVRMLLSHIATVRKLQDADNPINRFFATHEIRPFEHRILPFNPTMTLFQQPVEEMPRIWLRYLASIEPKFRKYISRHRNQAGAPPIGIPIEVNLDPNAPIMKAPLPSDFTKILVTRRKKKSDVAQSSNNTDTTGNLQTPEGIATNVTPIDSVVAASIFKLEGTGDNARIVPLIIQMNSVDETTTPTINVSVTTAATTTNTVESNAVIDLTDNVIAEKTEKDTRPITSTVNCNVTPISSTRSVPVESEKSIVKQSVDEPMDVQSIDEPMEVQPEDKHTNDKTSTLTNKPSHCKCCMLLRKVCKRQTQITEYFVKDRAKKSCFCIGTKHPRITKKLIQLVNTFKDPYRIAMENLCMKLCEADKQAKFVSARKRQNKLIVERKYEIEDSRFTDVEDLSYVIGYKMKLMARLGTNIDLKAKVHSIFSNFNANSDDPLPLAKSLNEVLTGHHSALFRDFLPFLTKEQAAKLGRFKDYFALVCVADLVKMVEEEIVLSEYRRKVLHKMHKVLTASAGEPTACQICTSLLPTFQNYPHLTQRVFNLFPHTLTTEDESVENGPSKSMQKRQSRRKVVKVPTCQVPVAAEKDQPRRVESTVVPPPTNIKDSQRDTKDVSVPNDDTSQSKLVTDIEDSCRDKPVAVEQKKNTVTCVVTSTPISNKTNQSPRKSTAITDINSENSEQEENEMDITLCVDSSQLQDNADDTLRGNSSQDTTNVTQCGNISQDKPIVSSSPLKANVILCGALPQDTTNFAAGGNSSQVTTNVTQCDNISQDKPIVSSSPLKANVILCSTSSHDTTNFAVCGKSSQVTTNVAMCSNISQDRPIVSSSPLKANVILCGDSPQNITNFALCGNSSQVTTNVTQCDNISQDKPTVSSSPLKANVILCSTSSQDTTNFAVCGKSSQVTTNVAMRSNISQDRPIVSSSPLKTNVILCDASPQDTTNFAVCGNSSQVTNVALCGNISQEGLIVSSSPLKSNVILCGTSSQDNTNVAMCGNISQDRASVSSSPLKPNDKLSGSSSQNPAILLSNSPQRANVTLCRNSPLRANVLFINLPQITVDITPCGNSPQSTANITLLNSSPQKTITQCGEPSQDTAEVFLGWNSSLRPITVYGDSSKLQNTSIIFQGDLSQDKVDDMPSGNASQNIAGLKLQNASSKLQDNENVTSGDSSQITDDVATHNDALQAQCHTDVIVAKNECEMEVDNEVDQSSSGENDGDAETELESIKEEPEDPEEDHQIETIQIFITDVKSENDSDENMEDNTETASREEPQLSDSEKSMVIDSDNETIKSETSEWQRDEDKVILQVIKDNLNMEHRGDKSILELVEDKQVIHLLTESLSHKSTKEIRNRMIYLIQMLLLSET